MSNLPDGWTEMTLGDFLTLQRGFDLPINNRKIGSVPVVASNGITGTHNEIKVKSPGVVIGRSGSIGGAQFITQDFWPLNTTLWVKNFKENEPRFAYYLLSNMDLSRFNAGSGVPSLNRNHIHPPVRAKMEGKQPVGTDTATANLFPDSFEESELGLIPRGWRVGTIGESVKIVGGSTPSTKNPDYWDNGHIYWTTPKDLSSLQSPVLLDTDRKITELGLTKISSGLLPKGTLLLSSRAPIGYLAISEIPVAINQGYIAMICDKELSNYYVLHWARNNMDVIIGRANGTTFLEISKSNFRPIDIIIPDFKILTVFNKQVNALHQKIVNNLQQSETLANIRDTLLPKLMSGEIRVKEAERIIEEVV
jgi:type I restriction enzyme S subunit